jgi:peptide/nickel transport system substrate-binding protein
LKRPLKKVGVALAAAGVLLASACGGGTKSAAARGGVLTISNESGTTWNCGFNPFNNAVYFLSTGNVYEPLMFENALQNQKTAPWLATGYSWSNGNKTLTFTIRDGVKWSDGQPFSADDVLFTLNLLKKYPAIDLNSVWSVISSVSRQGSDQVVVNFNTPAVPYFYFVADQLPIVPQHIWSTVGDPSKYNDNNPVGTGAYMVKPCTPQNITYVANPNYWQPGLPKIKKVLYPAFTSNDPANLYLATGQAQWGGQYIPNINSFYLRRSPTHHYWFPPIAQVSIFPNLTNPVLRDTKVRQALAYATDRARAASIGEGGEQPPATQLGIVSSYANQGDPAVASQNDYTFNPAKAGQILEADGYKKGSDGIYAGPAGKLSFTIITNSGYTDWLAALNVLKASFQQAGIGLTVLPLSQNDFQDRLNNGKFELAYYDEQTTGPSAYYELREWLYSANTAPIGRPASTNFERYSDKPTDALFDQYAGTTDPAAQRHIMGQVEQIMLQRVPVIPVTQAGDWYQYDTGAFKNWPTRQDPYALPAPYQFPDMGWVLLHLAPK